VLSLAPVAARGVVPRSGGLAWRAKICRYIHSGQRAGKAIDAWEIDLGAQRFIDVVGKGIQRDMSDDLQNFSIAITRSTNLFDFTGRHRAPSVDKGTREFDRDCGFLII